MIESKFAFFQMQLEGLFGYSSEPRESNFSPPPKVFNTVYVIMTVSELVVSMLDPIVFLIAEIHQPVIGLKAVCIDR